MKLIKLTLKNQDDETEIFYINPENIAFIEYEGSVVYIHFAINSEELIRINASSQEEYVRIVENIRKKIEEATQ